MSKKKILLIIVGVVAVAIAGYFLLRKKSSTPPQTGDDKTRTVVGGYSGKLFNIVKDPAKPFAENPPRSPEPSEDLAYKEKPVVQPETTQPSLSDEEYKKQVALGLMPDENGYYTQVIHPSGTNQWQANQTNFALDWDTFVNQYYPNYQDIIDGQTEGQLAGKRGEGLVIDNSPVERLPTTIADVPSVDSAQFNISSDNSAQAIQNYLTQLGGTISEFDMINDSNTLSTSIGVFDAPLLKGYQGRALAVQGRVKTVKVPSSMIGLSKSYLLMYQTYNAFIQDQIDIVQGTSESAIGKTAVRLEEDGKRFQEAYILAQSNTDVASNISNP